MQKHTIPVIPYMLPDNLYDAAVLALSTKCSRPNDPEPHAISAEAIRDAAPTRLQYMQGEKQQAMLLELADYLEARGLMLVTLSWLSAYMRELKATLRVQLGRGQV